MLGKSARGPLTYAGITWVGGAIDASIILDGDNARADAQVTVGGAYAEVAKRS